MSRQRAYFATLGSSADLIARQVVQFAVVVVLARLLTPSDFGVVALLGILVGIGTVLADAGLTTAILQSDTLDDGDFDTAFTLSLATGVSVTLVAAVLAWPLAALFDMEQYASLAAFMSLAIWASAAGQIQSATLIKRLRFSRLLVSGLVAAIVSGTLSISLALNGAGVWALGVQTVTMPAVSSIALFVIAPISPTFHWDRIRASLLLRKGRWVLAANLVDVGYLRLQYAVIGWLFGTAALGKYQRADSTQQIANDSAATVIGRVALPIFAESTGRPDLLRAGFLTGVRTTTTFAAPVMALMAALAEPMLAAVFGPQWTTAGPLLAALALAGLLWPFHVMAVNVLYAADQNRLVFRLDIVKKAVGLAFLLAGAWFGLLGIAVAQIGFGASAVVMNGWAVRRTIGLSIGAQTPGGREPDPARPSRVLCRKARRHVVSAEPLARRSPVWRSGTRHLLRSGARPAVAGHPRRNGTNGATGRGDAWLTPALTSASWCWRTTTPRTLRPVSTASWGRILRAAWRYLSVRTAQPMRLQTSSPVTPVLIR